VAKRKKNRKSVSFIQTFLRRCERNSGKIDPRITRPYVGLRLPPYESSAALESGGAGATDARKNLIGTV